MARQWTSGILPVIRCFIRCFFWLVKCSAEYDAIVAGDSDASLLKPSAAAVRAV